MAIYKVTHKTLGAGIVIGFKGEYVIVEFGKEKKQFALKTFLNFFTVYDDELKRKIEKVQTSVEVPAPRVVPSTPQPQVSNLTRYVSQTHISKAPLPLLGPRSQTILFASDAELFEAIGYMARPGRVSSIEAEVPKDGRDDTFEALFPGQKYRPIELGDTPSGLPNKLSPQFRINFASVRNCPKTLKANMGAGNGGCVARINKSRFVMDMVQNYGFRFGDSQNVSAIRKIAEARGRLSDFERGYSL